MDRETSSDKAGRRARKLTWHCPWPLLRIEIVAAAQGPLPLLAHELPSLQVAQHSGLQLVGSGQQLAANGRRWAHRHCAARVSCRASAHGCASSASPSPPPASRACCCCVSAPALSPATRVKGGCCLFSAGTGRWRTPLVTREPLPDGGRQPKTHTRFGLHSTRLTA